MKKNEPTILEKLWAERHRLCEEQKALAGDRDPLIVAKSIPGRVVIDLEFTKQCLGDRYDAWHEYNHKIAEVMIQIDALSEALSLENLFAEEKRLKEAQLALAGPQFNNALMEAAINGQAHIDTEALQKHLGDSYLEWTIYDRKIDDIQKQIAQLLRVS